MNVDHMYTHIRPCVYSIHTCLLFTVDGGVSFILLTNIGDQNNGLPYNVRPKSIPFY